MEFNPGFAVVSGIAALLALGALWMWRKSNREVAAMAGTQTSRAAEIAALAPGTIVEVKGTIRCDAPIAGEFSGLACVYARSLVERKEVRKRDGRREVTYTTERSTERHAPFHVEDESGRVLVRAEGASVDAPEVFNQSGNTATENLVSMATTLLGAGSQERRFRETALAPDTPVYVLGAVVEGGAIGAPPKDAAVQEFIVTHKSEEEHSASSRQMAMIMLGVAVALFALAAGALYAAFKYPV
jgi:hypothetical protein